LELIAYAHFLGVMDMGEAKTRFFKRNSEQADQLTIHPHKEREFWLWVASWALFVQRPSDLGYSDEGYELPALEVVWHEIPSTAEVIAPTRERRQGQLIKSNSIGIANAAKEKRESLPSRIAKLLEIRESEPEGTHRVIWHDLEAERTAIEKAIPGIATVYGAQKLDVREHITYGFRNGLIPELAGKPSMLGSGCNFQKHCHTAVFLGIGFKFNDFIQAIYRLQRFGQLHPVKVHIIYTEEEREVKESLVRKWEQDTAQRRIMSGIIREFGLSHSAINAALQRSLGATRRVEEGEGWKLVNDDSVVYASELPDNSQHMILTSIPFSTQYEYTPSLNDFGHTDDDAHFFAQMDYLTPELLRITQPGRIAAIHVKDRVVPGQIIGQSYQTISPFSGYTLMHMMKHGWTYMGMITIVTDVVRENAQTYRLSWTMQCEDGSRMGVGMPEYVLLFRKAPSDPRDGFADVPVTKTKEEYTRGRWQLDAHGMWRSHGNRRATP
ncbi:MAG: DNA methylase N-4, partial [Fimbriimonadaceae bacterium]